MMSKPIEWWWGTAEQVQKHLDEGGTLKQPIRELIADPKAIHEELKRDRERRTVRVRKHLLP